MSSISIDLHVHTEFSFDGRMTAADLLRGCREKGLAGLALTDHNSLEAAFAWAEELRELKVIAGEEVRSRHGEIIGLFLSEKIPRGLHALETMERIKAQGGLVLIPHPFDYIKLHRLSSRDLLRLRDRIDILEGMNGKPRFGGANDKALAFARRHGFIMSGGSDAHAIEHLGRVFTEMEDFTGPADFLANLRNARLRGSAYGGWSGQLGRWRARRRG
ncbi:MAG: PHP domain-containing protein [Candidatus Geothermincolia bacterium]